jgi:hypothetical protein
MHMGLWVGSGAESGPPPYATNKSWDWIVEETASLPDPIRKTSSTTSSTPDGTYDSVPSTVFWDWLFEKMAANGLAVYKLDHTQQQVGGYQVQ